MLKVSGEALEGKHGFGIDPEVLQTIAREVGLAVLRCTTLRTLAACASRHLGHAKTSSRWRLWEGAAAPTAGRSLRLVQASGARGAGRRRKAVPGESCAGLGGTQDGQLSRLESVWRPRRLQVAAAASEGVQVAVVVGGGNFFRGVDRWDGLDRATADYVG